jgi:ligand-binding sensor domain-containing protein/serine phosphatase RsbU (regulator of sigma subunit)
MKDYLRKVGVIIQVLWVSVAFAQKAPTPKYGLLPQKAISQYQCDIWQKPQGLPQNSIYSITQGHNGYLWLASYEGIGRFDGVEFKIYNTSNVKALRTSGALVVYEDLDKSLWFGTNNGGLTKMKDGKFTTYTKANGLSHDAITALVQSPDSTLWIGTRRGLSKFKNGKFTNYYRKDGLPSSRINTLYITKDNTLWIGTSQGVCSYKDNEFTDYTNKILLFSRNVTSLLEDGHGQIWIGTHADLVRWNIENEKQDNFHMKEGLTDKYITCLAQDHFGTLWIGTQSGGINRLTETEFLSEKPRFTHFTVREGLSANSVRAIYEDREGSLWIGLNRGGLNRLRDGKFNNYSETEGLPDNMVNCVLEAKDGKIWIGTVSRGVSYFQGGKFRTFGKAQGLSNNYIRTIAEDDEGQIWVGTYGGGINVLSFENEEDSIPKVKQYSTVEGLAGNVIRSISKGKNGALWIGTRTGLSKYKKGKFTNYSNREGLSENSILPVLEDRKGNLWAGTDGGGLNCVAPNGKVTVYSTSEGLNSDLIFSLYEDREGSIWIGTKGGLTRIKNNKVQSITVHDGLANDAIHSITEDDWHRVWMSSSNGIFWVKKKDLESFFDGKTKKVKCTVYGEDDGMKSSDCAPSVCRDRNGHLWYPTTAGLAVINPYNIRLNQLKPPVVINKVMADNKTYEVHERMEFAPGTSKFELHYAGLSLLAPNKVMFEVKLEGYDDDWIYVGSKREAYYNNLAPGWYTFRVRATNSDGLWNKEGTKIAFYIEPYFYQTRWFLALMVLLVISLGFLFYYLRVIRLQKRNEELESKIHERTKEIQTKAEELTTMDKVVRTINQEVKLEKVLQVLLEQAMALMPDVEKGIFLDYSSQHKNFKLLASSGYTDEELTKKTLNYQEVLDYYSQGEILAEGFYRLSPAKSGVTLMPNYSPLSSLIMAINIGNPKTVEGVMIFDTFEKPLEIKAPEIKKLDRFQEHAVSAFSKAQFLKEIQQKTAQVESAYKKTATSIRYARRIQQAILPEQEDIINYFKDAFILFEPRDIVSGDFYWFSETVPEPLYAIQQTEEGLQSVFKGFEDTKHVIAAVDCTGHGVPGAFMTLIGNDLLNAIVLEDKITKPRRILDKLDRTIKKYLKQEPGGRSNEGMDMALLVIDEENKRVEFAGAKNPLYLVRDGELTIIKGSKFPIGGAQIKNKKFESHRVPYQEGDAFYIFSDGFQDQFGGPKNSKYLSKRFRKFLLEISPLPMAEQKEILKKEFEDWKGDNSQTDDVVVIGMRF